MPEKSVFPGFFRRALPALAAALAFCCLMARAAPAPGSVIIEAWGDPRDGRLVAPAGLGKVLMMAAGIGHNLVLCEDGTVAAWGQNSYGQRNVPAGLENVRAIAAGDTHSLAARENGTVVAWGSNLYGERNVPAGLANVKAVSAGMYFSVALRENGTVAAWGDNTWGQRNVPGGLSNVTAIASGSGHTLALRENGTVVAWGTNTMGQCNVPADLDDVVAVAGGACFSMALRADGTIVSWGTNLFNVLNIPAGLGGVKAISAQHYNSTILLNDGTIVTTGRNDYGQRNVPEGLAGVKAIATGWNHMLALAHFLECGPDNYDFGNVNLGEEASKTFSLRNATPVTYALGQLSVSGGNHLPGEFLFSDDCSWQAVAPGQTVRFTVTFRPLLNGPRSASVTVPVGARSLQVQVSGTGGGDGLSVLIPVVYDGATGQKLAGATVAVNGETQVTGADGQCVFSALERGYYTIEAERDNYSPRSETVELPASSNIYRDLILYPEDFVEPTVLGIATKYGSGAFYVHGVSFNVSHTANIDWAGHEPGVVRFIAPNGVFEVAADGNAASRTFNMGSAFGPGGTLRVQAVTATGGLSEEKQADFTVARTIPLFPLAVIDAGASFSYASSLGLNWNFFSEGVPGADFPAGIPLFGSAPFLLKLVPTVSAGVSGTGAASIGLQFKGLEKARKIDTGTMAGFSLSMYPVVDVSGQYYPAYAGWEWAGYVGMHGELEYKKSWPFVVFVGPVPVPMYAKASLSLSAEALVGFANLDPLALNGRLTLGPYVRGSLGAGADELLAVEGWLGGGADIGLQFPEKPILDQLTIYINGGFTVYALLYTWETELLRWDWDLVGGHASAETRVPLSPAAPAVLSRTYLAAENYGRFTGGPGPADRTEAAGAPETPAATRRLTLQESVFPYPEASLASAGGHLYAAWLHDDPARSSLNRTVLVFSSFDGTAWSEPVPIADDGTADFHPDLVVFADGSAAVAWESGRTPLPDGATFEEMKQNLEIRVSIFDPDSRTWSAPHALTDNDHLDRSPKIRGSDRDNLMVIWVANPAGHVTGNTAQPNTIYSSAWDGAAWSEPGPVVDPALHPDFAKPLISYDFAYTGAGAASGAFFCLDMDEDNATDADREIFRVFRFGPDDPGGARWDDPLRLTSDDLVDAGVRVLASGSGATAWWIKDNKLYSAGLGDAAGTAGYSFEEFSSNLASFRIAASEGGRLALVWPEPSEFSSDLWVMFHDPAFGVWGSPQRLTSDERMERSPAIAFHGEETLVSIYDRVEVNIVLEERAILDGETRALPVRRLGSADLEFLVHEITTDLALRPGSLLLNPENPFGGSMAEIFATVVNAGNTAHRDIPVHFYAGDPADGGVLVGTALIAEILPPGGELTVSVSWAVPVAAERVAIHAVVDPDGSIPDDQPGNNTLVLECLFPDLGAVNLVRRHVAGDFYSLTGTIQNTGVLNSGEFVVEVRLGQVDGQLLHQETIAGLAPNEIRQVHFLWNATGIVMEDVRLYLVVDPHGAVAELDRNNNVHVHRINPALPLLRGDINADGIIDAADAVLCLRMAAGLPINIGGQAYTAPYTARQRGAADMDSSREIGISDALRLMRIILGVGE